MHKCAIIITWRSCNLALAFYQAIKIHEAVKLQEESEQVDWGMGNRGGVVNPGEIVFNKLVTAATKLFSTQNIRYEYLKHAALQQIYHS